MLGPPGGQPPRCLRASLMVPGVTFKKTTLLWTEWSCCCSQRCEGAELGKVMASPGCSLHIGLVPYRETPGSSPSLSPPHGDSKKASTHRKGLLQPSLTSTEPPEPWEINPCEFSP